MNFSGKKVEYEDSQSAAKDCKKDIKQGPFDVARFVFQPGKKQLMKMFSTFLRIIGFVGFSDF